MAHVREKIRLGTIERGQRIGAAPLRFPGGHGCQPRGDLRRDQIEEMRIVVIEFAQRIQADDHESQQLGLALLLQRQQPGLARGGLPRASRKRRGRAGQIGYRDGSGGALQLPHRPQIVVDRQPYRDCRVWAREAALRDTTRACAARLEQIRGGKREIMGIGFEAVGQRAEYIALAARAGQRTAQRAEQRQTPLADDAVRDLRDHAEHARNETVIAVDRAIRKRVIGFFGKAAAFQEQQQRLVPGGRAGRQNGRNARPDIRPDLLPHLVRAGTEHPVAPDADGRQIGVIAEKCELGPPQHPHRIA